MCNQKKPRSPWQAPNVRTDYTEPFVNDGYKLTASMIEKYRISQNSFPPRGNLRPWETMLFKNVSIFDVTGAKITWGDIAPEDVEGMLGVYYILSEHISFWDPPKKAVVRFGPTSDDPNSKSLFRHWLPQQEPMIMDIRYVKDNAIARIVDGVIHTSHELMMLNH